MPYEIALVNPRIVPNREGKTVKAKRNKSGQFVKRASNPRKRRRAAVASNPKPKRRKRRASNPRPIRRRHRARNPREIHRRKRARNPRNIVAGLKANAMNLIPAGMGAGAMLLSDTLMTFLPLPATFQTGMAAQGVRLAQAVVVASVLPHIIKGPKGDVAAHAALGIGVYGLMQSIMSQLMPGLVPAAGTSGFETMSVPDNAALPGYDPAPVMGAFPRRRMGAGAYMSPGAGAYMNAGAGAYMTTGTGDFMPSDYM
jgi:hypothetical protein